MNREEFGQQEENDKYEMPKGFTIGEGLRHNTGKPRYDLIPTSLLKGTADVFEFGMTKYSAWNWCKGMNFSKVIASMKRHLAAIETGEDNDPETHLRHVSHIICNCLMLEHYMNQGWASLDDRPKIYFSDAQPGDHGVDQEELTPEPFVTPDMYKQAKRVDQKLQHHTASANPTTWVMNETAIVEPNDKLTTRAPGISMVNDLHDIIRDKDTKQSIMDKLTAWHEYLDTFAASDHDFKDSTTTK